MQMKYIELIGLNKVLQLSDYDLAGTEYDLLAMAPPAAVREDESNNKSSHDKADHNLFLKAAQEQR